MAYAVEKTGEFEKWLNGLTDQLAYDAIIVRIARIEAGLMGDVKALGDGVGEFRIDVSGGYRLYHMRSGRTVILLLCGGTKKSQAADIRKAKKMAAAIRKAAKPTSGNKGGR
jgi:putative addiction module killer protein